MLTGIENDRPRLPVPTWALSAGAACLVAVLTWAVAWEPGATALGFRLDDAWIHLVYARSLWDHGALTYNDGVPATGATSPLWAMLLGGVYGLTARFSIDALVVGVYGVGVAFFAATAALAAEVGRVLGGEPVARLSGLAVVGCTPLAAASFSGMEVTLAAAALMASVHALLLAHPRRAGWSLAAAVTARPEAGLVFLVVAAWVAWRRPSQLAALVAPVLAVLSMWVAWNLYATGTPFPATFHMKADVSADSGSRFVVVALLLSQVPPIWGGLGLLGAVGFAAARLSPDPAEHAAARQAAWPLLAGLVFLLGNVLITRHSDFNFYYLRYLLPAVPLLLVAIAWGWTAAGPRWLGSRAWLAPAVFAALCGAGIITTVQHQSHLLHNDTRNINEVQRAMGTWIGEHVGEGQWIATSDAGAVRFFSERPTIDLLGLNTPRFTWEGASWARARPVVATATMPAWLSVEHPERLVEAAGFETEDYMVTGWPAMARQVVHVCAPSAVGEPVRFTGVVTAEVWCGPLD